MDFLVEFYDDSGRCFRRFHSADAIQALTDTVKQCEQWRSLGFRNASCYYRSKEEWNLEIKS